MMTAPLEDSCAGLKHAHLRVGIIEWYPFIMADGQRNGVSTYRGFSIDLLNIVATACNFSYTLVLPPDGEWGDKRDGQWTGLIGQLHRKETDLNVAPLYVSELRSEAADNTVPVYYATSKMAVRRESSVTTQWGVFLRPFHGQVFVVLLAVFVCSTLLLMILVRTRYKLFRPPCLGICELMFGSFVQEAMHMQWTDGSLRVFFAAWCLMSLVLSSCYTSKLTSLLVNVTPPPPFTSLADMMNVGDFRWGTIGGSKLLTSLRLAREPDIQAVYQGLMNFAEDDPEVLSHDPEVHLAKVLEGNYAFLIDSPTVDLWQQEYCEVLGLLEGLFGMELFAFHAQKNSSLTAPLSLILLRLHDTGVMSYLHAKWFPSQAGCQDNPSSPPSITMTTMQGPVYTMVVAVVVAAGVLLAERGVSWRRGRRMLTQNLKAVSS